MKLKPAGYCIGNRYSPSAIVAPVTANHESKAKFCYIDSESGLDASSVILLEQLRTNKHPRNKISL